MPPSKSSADKSSSLLYALVLFVVLFLAAAVLALVLFLNTEKHVTARQEAEQRLALLATGGEYNSVRGLAETAAGRVRVTAMGRLIQQMQQLAELIGGEDIGDVPPTGAQAMVDERIAGLWDEVAMALAGTSEQVDESLGLARAVELLIEQGEYWQQRASAAETNLAEQMDSYDRQIASLRDQVADLNEQLEAASRAAQTQAQAYQALQTEQTSRYEEIIGGLNRQLEETQARERELREQGQQLQRTVAQLENEVRQLNNRLKAFQPDPETEAAALDSDGHVVSAVMRDRIAYINLGRNDRVYRGLTFTVYDSYQPIPRSGQGKGTLEIVEIMDTVSRARIVDYDRGNPILAGDIIANLVWDAERTFHFCVIGDFDLDGDGTIDPDGRARIVAMIEEWGGVATDRVSVETDFLVYGRAPEVPGQPDQYMGEDTAAAQAYRDARTRAEAYEETLQRAGLLGVPVFNQARFFNFIGYKHQPQLLR